jgi:hypothetical protein
MLEDVRHRRIAVAAVVGLAAVGLVATATGLKAGSESSNDGSPALKIALFTPPPPMIEPGEVMGVGELTDGYRHVPPPEPEPVEWVEMEEGWWDEPVPLPEPRYERVSQDPASEPRPVEPANGDAMGFGFEPVEAADRRIIRSAPPERQPGPEVELGGRTEVTTSYRRPPPVAVTGERRAIFY